MGKRKSARKPQGKKKSKLDTSFRCLLCNHEESVTVNMDKQQRIGTLRCKVCSARFESAVTHLSDAVDVYSDWVDACNQVNQPDEYASDDSRARRRPADRPPPPAARDEYGVPTQLSENESDIDDF
ncbi:hypothetical protein H4S01_005676 [Coemansia sp. RSA 2610]|nr:hypothetical protein H4S01_005676 [Coemansia sp. RSA 2610]